MFPLLMPYALMRCSYSACGEPRAVVSHTLPFTIFCAGLQVAHLLAIRGHYLCKPLSRRSCPAAALLGAPVAALDRGIHRRRLLEKPTISRAKHRCRLESRFWWRNTARTGLRRQGWFPGVARRSRTRLCKEISCLTVAVRCGVLRRRWRQRGVKWHQQRTLPYVALSCSPYLRGKGASSHAGSLLTSNSTTHLTQLYPR